MNCKECNSKTHYCTNCDSEHFMDEGFCSDKCWKESDDYNIKLKRFVDFYYTLNSKQRIYIRELLDCEEHWIKEFENWINKK